MLKARVDPSRLIPLDPPDKEDSPRLLRELQANPLFPYLLARLQLKYLKHLRDRQSSDKPEYAAFNAGVATGADSILGEIDAVVIEVAKIETEEV